mmetsp:Transcript_18344/g.57715  ORF Transcript_18344/g.57715 Transcript_18344/m.57715 type:complete len:233 (-) Transcript_18344:1450-2148(-)
MPRPRRLGASKLPPRRSLLELLADSRSACAGEQVIPAEGDAPISRPQSLSGRATEQAGQLALVAPLTEQDPAPAEDHYESSSSCSRCLQGVSDQGGSMALRCARCSGAFHADCIHPPLPDHPCRRGLAGTWICDACAQEQYSSSGDAETGHYSFCLACAWNPGSQRSPGGDLVHCSSCRASYHPECLACPGGRGGRRGTCTFCSDFLDKHRVHLTQWSPQLVSSAAAGAFLW